MSQVCQEASSVMWLAVMFNACLALGMRDMGEPRAPQT